MPALLTNQTTDVDGASTPWTGGAGTLFVRGTIKRPTQVLLQVEKNGRWVTANHRLTARNEMQEDFVLAACNLRAKLINAQGDTNVTVDVDAI